MRWRLNGKEKSEYRAVFLRGGETDLPPEQFFSEQFHGIGADPPAGSIFCTEVTLKDPGDL
jgi:hypothetical protein